MDPLLQQYTDTYRRLNKEKAALPKDDIQHKIYSSMLIDLDIAIKWLRNGYNVMGWRTKGIYGDVKGGGYDKRRTQLNLDFLSSYDDVPSLMEPGTHRLERQLSEKEKRAIMRVIQNMTPLQANCFMLHTVYMESLQTIADSLGITKSTVYSHVTRAREKIEKIAPKVFKELELLS